MGKKRRVILDTLRCSFPISIFLIFSFVTLLKEYSLLAKMDIIFILSIFIVIISNVFYGIYKKLNKKKYGFRLLSEKEWVKFKNMNLIHYSNILSGEEGEREIFIPAHTSPKVNLHLPKKYREKGFVWFHIADGLKSEEPVLSSFLNAHLYEGNPRKQKIVVKIEELPKNRLYLDIKSGYFLVMGDLSVKANVYHNFKWYNEKLYILFLLNVAVDSYLTFFYDYQHQMKVKNEELNYQRKIKKECS